MPIVSVIIPNYNHSLYLNQRIESVLNQTFQDFELIILDDCSTDNSKEVIEQYRSHPKVSAIIYNENNSGSTFKQWRKGIEFAKGTYIWIAESDDYCHPTFLEKCLQAYSTDESVGMVFCQSYSVNQHNELKGTWLSHTASNTRFDWNKDFMVSGEEFIKNGMVFQNSIPNASAVLFKKEALNIDLFNHLFKLNGDWYLYIMTLLKSSIGYIAEPLNYFRIHDNKGSIRNTKNYKNILEFAHIILLLNKELNFSNVEKKAIKNYFFSVFYNQITRNRKYILTKNFWEAFLFALKVDNMFILKFCKALFSKSLPG